MESEDWEHPPTPPPKDARYTITANIHNTTAMDGDTTPAPASGSKRKRVVQDFDDTIYERRNGQLEAINGDQDLPTAQKRPRSHASNSNYNSDDEVSRGRRSQKGSLRRMKGFGNLSNMNLRHAASTAFGGESPTRESRFQEGSLNDKPSQQPPSVFTRIMRTDSGNLQQVDELMNDYHDDIAAPRESTEDYEKATIEHEKATIPARVAEITEQRKREEGKRGMFRFGKSFTNTFHPVQLWNRMWSESREELIAKNRLEAERKAREKAEIQARYDQMKRDGQFNMQHIPFAGKNKVDITPTQDAVMADNVIETGIPQRVDSLENRPSMGDAASFASSDARNVLEDRETNETVPTTAAKGRFARLHFRTPSISNLRETLRSVRSVRSYSALGSAIDNDSNASASVSPAKADLSTLKKSISRYDLKKERRLSNRVSDLESKLNKARLELKNALDDASPMPKLGSRYERFTPIATSKRSRFVPGALATLPSERLLFPDMDGNEEQQGQFLINEVRPRNTLELNNGMDINKAFENIYDEDELQDETTVRGRREENQAAVTEMSEPADPQLVDTGVQPTEDENRDLAAGPSNGEKEVEKEEAVANKLANPALHAKFDTLEASIKAANKPAKSKKRRSGAAIDEKSYRPGREDEGASEEEVIPQKKRKGNGKATGGGKKKSPGEKAMKKTSIPVPVADAKGKKGKTISKPAESFFTSGKHVDDIDSSSDELAPAVPAGAVSDVPSLEPVYEEEEEVTTIPLKDVPSKPTAKSTPARYGSDKLHSAHIGSPHKKRSDSLQPAVHGGRQRSAGRSPPPPKTRQVEVVEEAVIAVPGQNGVPRMPVGDGSWSWPPDVF